jgi:ATP-dependent DNA helicase RecQ
MFEKAQLILNKVYGFSEFRGLQENIIRSVLDGKDTLVLMPTGGGKSLCYQIPSVVKPGLGVIISPLISLMKDQVYALTQNGIRAAYLNSSLSEKEAGSVKRAVASGELDLLYVAPERALMDGFKELISNASVSLFAIDEAHCVSQWGHDFRPEYLQLRKLIEQFPDVPRMALTATADEPTRKEIISKLNLRITEKEKFVSSFDRPNICYAVEIKDNAKKQLLNFIRTKHADQSGIVYCLSRKKVDQTASWLEEEGFRAIPYHAGLTPKVREENQEIFALEEGVIVVATIAFGMGIDKSNVRFVAHMDLPSSVEAYYQETGRAGRDGLPADAWMVYGLSDVVSRRQMIETSRSNNERKKIENTKLTSLLGYAETISCRRKVLLNYFSEETKESCGNCDNCLSPVDSIEGKEIAQKALSCVFKTGQRFGAAYLTDVLRGETNDRIENFGHTRISTYGIGSDLSKQEWSSVFRQLVASGYLGVDIEGYGGLFLTEESQEVLRGNVEVRLRKDPIPVKIKKEKKKKDYKDYQLKVGSESLFEELRKKRLELAKAQNLPPYVIFHDTTLRELANIKPQSLADMRSITGIGEQKLSRYGEQFLKIIQGN